MSERHGGAHAAGRDEDEELVPEPPREAGVDEAEPEAMQVEGARLLADQARERLRGQGFGDEQIRLWAGAYVRERGAGDVDDFLDWIQRQER
ncbi:hypothetical protein BH20ACT9_BH20ACT9_07150 [soil metagenome]